MNIVQGEFQVLDGKATSKAIREELKKKVEERLAEGKRRPHLSAVLVGHDGGSEAYVALR